MIPVDQRVVLLRGRRNPATDEAGDCLRAVVASIFEVSIDDVPHFCDTGLERPGNRRVWAYALIGWCFEQGAVIDARKVTAQSALPYSGVPGYCILSGPGPRGWRHSVVGYQGRMVHDPHPSRAGLETIDEIEILIPINNYAAAVLARAPELER